MKRRLLRLLIFEKINSVAVQYKFFTVYVKTIPLRYVVCCIGRREFYQGSKGNTPLAVGCSRFSLSTHVSHSYAICEHILARCINALALDICIFSRRFRLLVNDTNVTNYPTCKSERANETTFYKMENGCCFSSVFNGRGLV